MVTRHNQDVPDGVLIECSKSIRALHIIGTIFKVNVKVSKKPTGRIYLHSIKKQELLTEAEWNNKYNKTYVNL